MEAQAVRRLEAMPVSRRTIKGTKLWVIDRRFRSADGREERFWRAAQVQSKRAPKLRNAGSSTTGPSTGPSSRC